MTSCRHMLCEPSSVCQVVPAEELVEAISDAIHRADMPAVADLLGRLEAVDPVQAQLVLDTIQAGLQAVGSA